MRISELELMDMDDLYGLSSSIEATSLQLEGKKQELTTLLAFITKLVTSNDKYWIGGKPPSVSFIKEQYHILGYDDDTLSKLASLREAIYSLDTVKSKYEREFYLALKLLDVWRTYSANKRRSSASFESGNE